MQSHLSLCEFLTLEPAPKLNDGLGIPSEPFHITAALGLLGQVIQHKLIEIIHQISRQLSLASQILRNLIEIAIQQANSPPLPLILQALGISLDNPPKALSLIAPLVLPLLYIITLLFYKICYIFLITEDLSPAILFRFFGGEADVMFILDMQIKCRKCEVFLTALACVNLLCLGEFARTRGLWDRWPVAIFFRHWVRLTPLRQIQKKYKKQIKFSISMVFIIGPWLDHPPLAFPSRLLRQIDCRNQINSYFIAAKEKRGRIWKCVKGSLARFWKD